MLRGADPAGVTLNDISRMASVAERDVPHHLAHLDRSLSHGPEELLIDPARCVGCGFVFAKRTRFVRPGQCPDCKARRITLPRFRILPRKR